MDSSPQAQWVADAIRGDTDAYGRLIQAHTPAVCAITLAITRDPHHSEEVAQDVFLLAWTRLPHLKNPASFGPWLRQISRNRSREHLRSARRRRTTLDNDAVDRATAPDDPASVLLDAEERQVLAEALDALPDETREVLILYYREGRSVRQVATLLDLSEAAVRKRLSRARARLRDEVEDRFEAVLLRTVPGVGLTLGLLTRLPPRSPWAAVSTQLGAWGPTVLATTGLAVVGLLAALALAPARPASTLDAQVKPRQDTPSPADTADRTAPADDPDTPSANRDREPASSFTLRHAADEHLVGHRMNPLFGPGGRHLAFELNRQFAGEVDIVVLSLDTDTPAQVIALPGGTAFGAQHKATSPAWHPEGILVFEGSASGSASRLYYHQPGGGTAAEMIGSHELSGALTSPTISPDGSQLALIHGGDLVVRATATGTISRVQTPQTEAHPAFLGEHRLLFTREVDGADDVFVHDLITGESRPVITGPGDQTRPQPAGDRVVYFDRSAPTWRWRLMSATRNGDQQTELATSVQLPPSARPAISPDRQWVAFTWDDADRATTVEFVRVDGSDRRTLTTNHSAVGEPALGGSPDQLLLAYTALPTSLAQGRQLHVQDITENLR